MRTIKQYKIQRRLLKNGIRKRDGIDTGFVFTPYLPAQLEPLTIDNQPFGVSSVYAFFQVDPNYFSIINITNA